MGNVKSRYCECKQDQNHNLFAMEYDIGMLSPEGDSVCKNCKKIKICDCDEETRIKFSNEDFLTTNKKKCCGKCRNYLM